jgi:hypothetical protein
VEYDNAFAGNQVIMKRSTDGGLTWTSSTVPGISVLGGQPVVQPNGTVVMPIENVGTGGIASLVSTNGGSSYSQFTVVSSVQAHGNFSANFRDGEGLPSAEVAGDGKVFVAWSDCRFRPSCKANDIVFSTSTDGQTWTAPARIPIGATSSNLDLYIPGIAVDKSTSGATTRVAVAAYVFTSPSCSPTTCQLNAVFVKSSNGGATWSRPKVLIASPAINLKGLPLTNQGYMVGDYMSTSYNSAGRAFPVFANATGSTCTQGQITSCNEFMVTPTGGLGPQGPFSPAVQGPVYAGGRIAPRLGATAS